MPLESPFPPLHIENVGLWDFLFERKDREFPDEKVIFLQPEVNRSYTYAQVRSTAIEFGQGLRAVFDWQKDDVLALYTPNCIDTPAVTWGCHWAGGIVSPANPLYTADELTFQLKDAGAKALVTHESCLPVALKAAKMVGLVEDRIILIGDISDPQSGLKHFTSIRDTSGTTKYSRPNINPKDDTAFLVYSSGTTGLPKGVILTHMNIVSNSQQVKATEFATLGWRGGPDGQGDKMMGFLPFFHIYGLTLLVHGCLYLGLTLIIMARFDLEKFCKLVQEHKATIAYVAPPVVLLLSKHPIVNQYDLSSLRMMTCGAAPLTSELAEAMYQRIKVPVKQAYGLSETSPAAAVQQWDDWQRFCGSVGRLCPNVSAKIVSPDGSEVAASQTGEIWVKGPNIFKGYLNNPKGTANAFSEDGYFKTGDIGYADDQGNFYITDRLKELIKYKSFQVAPAELEGVLVCHPKIDDVAVMGVYDANQATELPRAYVVAAKGVKHGKETEEEMVGWLAGKVASYKRLRGGIRFVDEIPKSTSGKILRRILKLQATQEEDEKKMKSKL